MSEYRKHTDLFMSSGCLTLDAMKKFHSGELNDETRELIKYHLTTCELCSDAFEGLQYLLPPEKLDAIISEINENSTSYV